MIISSFLIKVKRENKILLKSFVGVILLSVEEYKDNSKPLPLDKPLETW